ncbi:MAG: hypothetical protein AB8C02_01690 [Halioglobus sp.]
MTEHLNHMILGLQSSGKSTFAGALWHLIDSGEVPTVLERGSHSGDYSHVEMLANYWAAGWRVPRTSGDQVEDISINLRQPSQHDDIRLSFPDLSGETFERAFATRYVDDSTLRLLGQMDGLLVFLNTERPRDDISILDVAKFIGPVPESENETEVSFDASLVPHQVQIVDLLQTCLIDPKISSPKRLAVVVSAWDNVAEHIDPDLWLRQQMPLLEQFLSQADVEFRVYGVSAQGGSLPKKDKSDDGTDRQELLKLEKASERIEIKGHGAASHDLTHIVRWLSGLEPHD